MNRKKTGELEKILHSTDSMDIARYLQENQDEILQERKPFAAYMREHIKGKGLNWQTVFLQADVDEHMGYKIIEEEIRTRQRDLIIRICYAAKFTLDELQHALIIYGMAPLIASIDRDAVLIIAFNTRPGNILEVNGMLRRYKLKPLRFYTKLENTDEI